MIANVAPRVGSSQRIIRPWRETDRENPLDLDTLLIASLRYVAELSIALFFTSILIIVIHNNITIRTLLYVPYYTYHGTESSTSPRLITARLSGGFAGVRWLPPKFGTC